MPQRVSNASHLNSTRKPLRRNAYLDTGIFLAMLAFMARVIPIFAAAALSTLPVLAQEAPVPPIDTSNKQAVVDAYRAYYLTSEGTGLVWTGGSWDPANPGTINEQFRTENLRRLNWVRAMAGLPGNVIFDATLNAKCQAGALMISKANNFPPYSGAPTDWPAYSPDGSQGCQNSNLSAGSTFAADSRSAISSFVNEALDNVGHRWWFLRPGLSRSGIGAVPPSDIVTPNDFRFNSGYTVWVATAGPTSSLAPVVAWPPAGYFPAGAEMPIRWSFFLDAADFTNATVTMSKNGSNLATEITARLPAGSDSGIVWRVPADLTSDGRYSLGKSGDTYSVSVGGIVSGGQSRSFIYTVSLIEANASKLINISTRLRVETGDNVGIAGFVVQGDKPRRVIVRALGPSLTAAGVADALANPTLALRNASNELVVQNDDWQTQTPAARGVELLSVSDTGLAPSNPREAAVAVTLQPGAYTTVVSEAGGGMGVALVEVYDLDVPLVESRAVNVSTRGKVGIGDNVMIGGFVIGGSIGTPDRVTNGVFVDGTARPVNVIVRALGPSLTAAGVSGVLTDPMLEIRDATGTLVTSNWHFRSDPAVPAGLVPSDSREVVIARRLMPGAYTAVVRGKNGATGVALIEAYEVP